MIEVIRPRGEINWSVIDCQMLNVPSSGELLWSCTSQMLLAYTVACIVLYNQNLFVNKTLVTEQQHHCQGLKEE